MRNNRMSWIVGLGAMALAIAGWMLPRRRKTPMQKVMHWGEESVQRIKRMRIPLSPMMMKSGLRMVKGMLR